MEDVYLRTEWRYQIEVSGKLGGARRYSNEQYNSNSNSLEL